MLRKDVSFPTLGSSGSIRIVNEMSVLVSEKTLRPETRASGAVGATDVP